MLNSRLEGLRDYPFQRLATLVGTEPPRINLPLLDLSVGEPRRPPPPMVAEIVQAKRDTWNRYPGINGTVEFRAACANWLNRRYSLPDGMIDAEAMITPCAGTREGLYMAATVAVSPREDGLRPLALMPNPFYQVYVGASVLAGAEPLFMATSKETGFLPDLDALDPATLDRTALCYLCSPANPQGAVASLDYWKRALELARRHDFLLVADECYAEIYSTDAAPRGALEAAAALGGSLDNLLVFHTLSKRSSVPGLRSGFSVGSPHATMLLRRLRTYGCAGTPLATLEAATALWNDEEHVVETRAEYREKFDIAEKLLAGRFGFYRPQGGFYLWLDVGDGEEATRRLWLEAGVKVLPGAYLTRHDAKGPNPNQGYIRLALVDDAEKTKDALTRFLNVLQ
jgi:aspartate/methionine/tyrosine aminotransferase